MNKTTITNGDSSYLSPYVVDDTQEPLRMPIPATLTDARYATIVPHTIPAHQKGELLSMSLITSIHRHFDALPDPRIDRCKQHKLLDIITIAICAVISNADGWLDIEAYGRAKQAFFRQFLDLPHGIPSHDTFGRVFARLNPTAFQQAFVAWVDAIRLKLPGDVIALDGKTERRTHDRAIDLSPLHIVSAWSTANSLVLGQIRVADKSNEITAIPLLLELLDLQGCIITIDALGCQVAIAEQIIVQEAEYVLACKGNQGHLARDVEQLFAQLFEQGEDQAVVDYCKSVHEAHGRREVREYWSTDQLERISTRARWPQMRSVAMVRSERTIAGVTSVETRQYISSLPSGAERLAYAIRNHWGIENQVHWVLDVVFAADDSRARIGHSAHNLAIIRHLVLNLLRQETTLKTSLRQKRLRAGWDDAYLWKVLQNDPQE
jgi:predicted transposase YbfD/YdcC